MSNSKLAPAIALMTLSIGLTACSGRVRYPSYYVLSVPPAPTLLDRSAPTLGAVAVREFDSPAFLKRGPLVYRASADELDFYDYHRWAEDPRRTVTTAMVHKLLGLGMFQSVSVSDGRGSPEFLMTGSIDHLEEVDEGSNVSVEVGLSARLVNLRTGNVVWQDTSSKNARVDQRTVDGVVAAMSREVGDVTSGLISSLQTRVSANSASLSIR